MTSRIERLTKILQKRPTDSFARYGLAMEYRNQGEHAEAEKTFAELVEQDPDYVAAYYHYGMTLKDTGRPERAEVVFRQGLEAARRKQDAHAYSELERALQEL